MAGNLWLRNPDEMARHVSLCLLATEGRDPQDEWGEHPGLMDAIDEELIVAKLVDASAPGWPAEECARKLVAGRSKLELVALALRGDPYTFMTFPETYQLLTVAMSGEIHEADPGKLEKHHPKGKAAMERLWDGLRDWVAVPWMPTDMPRLVAQMQRRTVILVDTDSTFLNLHPWMKWVEENCDHDMQDEGKRLTAMNVMVYLLRLMNDWQMWALMTNLGVPEHKRRLINFKSEFVISRMVITGGKKHYTALLRFQEGARIVCGGGTPELPAHLKGGNWVQPTVFADVDNKMKIAQDEIFGPVPCLIRFKTEEDAIRIANDTPYGLSSYLWTENTGRVLRMAKAIESGMTFVNSQNVRDLRQPFGGTKASGTGREGNHYSYEVFCEAKNVAISYGSHHIPRWGV